MEIFETESDWVYVHDVGSRSSCVSFVQVTRLLAAVAILGMLVWNKNGHSIHVHMVFLPLLPYKSLFVIIQLFVCYHQEFVCVLSSSPSLVTIQEFVCYHTRVCLCVTIKSLCVLSSEFVCALSCKSLLHVIIQTFVCVLLHKCLCVITLFLLFWCCRWLVR